MQIATPLPFIFILDKYGNAVDIFSADSRLDYIHDIIRILNQNLSDAAPHIPWFYDGFTMTPLTSSTSPVFTKETLH